MEKSGADGAPPAAKSPADTETGAVSSAHPLSADEQMERFAQELKETDWGHQPC